MSQQNGPHVHVCPHCTGKSACLNPHCGRVADHPLCKRCFYEIEKAPPRG
jgi:hypothetical protein